MEDALTRESPRLTPRPVPAISVFICTVAAVLFVLLLLPAFFRQNLAAWSLGVAYILYDTILLGFTAAQIFKLRQTFSNTPARRPTLGAVTLNTGDNWKLGVGGLFEGARVERLTHALAASSTETTLWLR